METRCIIALVGLLATTAVLADAYKWLDAEGVVQYSDRPQPGAERISLPSDSRAAVTAAPRQATNPADQPATEAAAFRYTSLSVESPGAEETLWNIEGVLSVSLALTPALQNGHQLRVHMDGAPRPQLVNSQNFQLEEVFRGVHNLQVEVIDETGKTMIRSRPNRFYVQQNKVILRAR